MRTDMSQRNVSPSKGAVTSPAYRAMLNPNLRMNIYKLLDRRVPGDLTSKRSLGRLHAKNNKSEKQSPGRRKRKNEGEEDVELFNINSGWNENAFAVAAEVLSEMHGWEVGAGVDLEEEAPVGEIIFENEANFGDRVDDGDADESGMIWSVSELSAEEMAIESSSLAESADHVTSENILRSIPRHVLRRLEEAQESAIQEEEKLDPNKQRKVAARSKTHRKLRIISGTAASVRLISPQGDQTRPMMEKVRGAVFSMIGSLYGSTGGLPEDTRWLDLFAGTGAVGIEAMSRGVGEGHFVELSDWVVNNCLSKNIENCKVHDRAVIHTMKAEEYLKRAASFPTTTPFDFISVCPPYELVSYPEIYDLLEASNLIGENTIVLVEYPQRVREHILDTLGPLAKVRDRKYGRTLLALYAPKYVEK
jgi:16S rRNA (guanine(966)-N(2))-methyltransferase RsmD